MPVEVRIEFYRPEPVVKLVESGLASAAGEAGQALRDHVRMMISRPNPLGTSPSAPFEPPASVTGELLDSVAYDVADTGRGLSITVGAGAPYALALEYGTRHMAQRPFLRPALAQMEGQIAGIFFDALAF